MKKILELSKKYWFVLVGLIVVVLLLIKKKKSESTTVDKETIANAELAKRGIKDATSKDRFKSYASQIADKLGTAYAWYNPKRWSEEDDEVYDLVKELDGPAFKIVADLYFTSYAKGRDLRTDLANLLDSKLYKLLPVK